MLLDHIVAVFISHDTMWGMALRVPGRITAPIMCYLISEGFYYTSNKRKYLGRMFLFALISHFPYNLCLGNSFPVTSVMWTLSLGLTALTVVKKDSIHLLLKILAVLVCCALAFYANWNFVGVLWIVFFGVYRGDRKKQIISFCVIGFCLHVVPTFTYLDQGFEHNLPHWYQLFIFVAVPLILLYNGQKGSQSKFMYRFFYIFYPAHLIIIYLAGLIFIRLPNLI